MISYCVRTNSARKRELEETIKSIRKQKGDQEIIVTGILNQDFDDIIYYEMSEEANTGRTSQMRDKGFELATGEFIVALDDDIILHDGFQEAIGSEDIQIPQCYNILGGRFWDWCVLDHPEYGHSKIDYKIPYTKHHYLSGQCFIIKSDIAKQVKHSSELKFHESDDVDYGKRLQSQGFVFTMNEKTICTHFDARYRSINDDKGIARYG